NEVFAQLQALASGKIDNIDQREYIDIEYHTDTPPRPNLRQQFEDVLPKERYRLVKISRQYKNNDQQNHATKIQLEPPTPEKLFEQIWQNKGYAQDAAVLKDFQTLVQEARHSLEDKNSI
ncbi:MAG: exonuclease SbcCD subunit D C-terminal domain-containing protein, partial [Acinetobacter sp.]